MSTVAYRWWLLRAAFARWRLQCARTELQQLESPDYPVTPMRETLRQQVRALTAKWLIYEARAAMAQANRRTPA